MNDLLVNTVNQIAFYFLRRSERLMLHGGAVVVNNEAVLFSGLSHVGKPVWQLMPGFQIILFLVMIL